MAAPSRLSPPSPFPVGGLKDLTLPQPHPLPSSPYCIVKKSSTTPLPTRKKIHKKEIKYSLSSLSLVTDPQSSSQSGMGGLNAQILVFPTSVSLRNCIIAPVAFSTLNNLDILPFPL